MAAAAGCSSTSQREAFEDFRQVERRSYGVPVSSGRALPRGEPIAESSGLEDCLK